MAFFFLIALLIACLVMPYLFRRTRRLDTAANAELKPDERK